MTPGTTPWSWLQSLPNVTRLTLRRECVASLPLAVMLGVLSAPICGFVGVKALHMSDSMLGMIMACQMAGLLLAGLLVGFFHQARKIKALSRVLLVVSVVLLSISLTPTNASVHRLGGYLFMVQIFLAQIGIALMVTLRTNLWRANYPAAHRGKIVVSIYFLVMIAYSLTIHSFTALMDEISLPFQAVYGISGGMGLLSAYFFSRLRIHREQTALRNLSNNTPRLALLSGLSVLRKDKRFRRYMEWQMLNGFSTLIIEMGVLVLIIQEVFESGWWEGGAALTGVQALFAGIAGLVWAGIYDRSNIFTMRFYGAMGWSLSRLVLVLGVYFHSIGIIILSRAVSGIAMGAGRLNWRLGHMEFASPEEDSLYMGAHVTLTGVRGIVAPFLGIYLYRLEIFGPDGIWLIALSGVGQAISGLGFLTMRRPTQK